MVGIYCEFTPREVIMAANAVPVCLCGASASTIPIAETVLPSNLCPLIKSSFGYILSGSCPFFPSMDLIVAETTCDGKKKMYELIEDRKPMHVLELTQKVREAEALAHWTDEVRKLRVRLEGLIGHAITDDELRTAIRAMNEERALLLRAMRFGAERPSIATGVELSAIRYRVSGMPGHLDMLRRFIAELEGRKLSGHRVAPAAAPRVMLTGCPTAQGTIKLIEVIEECGAVVVVQETCSGVKPLLEQVDEAAADPIAAIAQKYFKLPCSCMTPNAGRVESITALAAEYQVDAVVDLVWMACHTYNIEAHLISKQVRETLGLAYLKVETDYSDADRERIKVRVQTMLEMLQ